MRHRTTTVDRFRAGSHFSAVMVVWRPTEEIWKPHCMYLLQQTPRNTKRSNSGTNIHSAKAVVVVRGGAEPQGQQDVRLTHRSTQSYMCKINTRYFGWFFLTMKVLSGQLRRNNRLRTKSLPHPKSEHQMQIRISHVRHREAAAIPSPLYYRRLVPVLPAEF